MRPLVCARIDCGCYIESAVNAALDAVWDERYQGKFVAEAVDLNQRYDLPGTTEWWYWPLYRALKRIYVRPNEASWVRSDIE